MWVSGWVGGVALFGRRVKDDCADVTLVLQEILNLVIADTKVKQASLGIQRCFFGSSEAAQKQQQHDFEFLYASNF